MNKFSGAFQSQGLALRAERPNADRTVPFGEQSLPHSNLAEADQDHLGPAKLSAPWIDPDHRNSLLSTEQVQVVIRGHDDLIRSPSVIEHGLVAGPAERGFVYSMAHMAHAEVERTEGCGHLVGQELVEQEPDGRAGAGRCAGLAQPAAAPAPTGSSSNASAVRT